MLANPYAFLDLSFNPFPSLLLACATTSFSVARRSQTLEIYELTSLLIYIYTNGS